MPDALKAIDKMMQYFCTGPIVSPVLNIKLNFNYVTVILLPVMKKIIFLNTDIKRNSTNKLNLKNYFWKMGLL